MNHRQLHYEPGQETRGLPGPEAYDEDGSLLRQTRRESRITRYAMWARLMPPEAFDDTLQPMCETGSNDWRAIAGRLISSSAGMPERPCPDDLRRALSTPPQTRTLRERCAVAVFVCEADEDEIWIGWRAGMYSWRALVQELHRTKRDEDYFRTRMLNRCVREQWYEATRRADPWPA